MRFITILLITLFSACFSVFGQTYSSSKIYTLTSDSSIVIQRTIENIAESDSSSFVILKKFMIDYFSASYNKLTETSDEKKEINSKGRFNVGNIKSDRISASYTLNVRVQNKTIFFEFIFNDYTIGKYESFCSCYTTETNEKIATKYPISLNIYFANKYELAFNSIFEKLDEIITKIDFSISENNYINDSNIDYKVYSLANFQGSYIVTINRDTIPVNVMKSNLKTLRCDSAGISVKYKAKNILAYIDDNTVYESGRVHDKGLGYTRWIFFQKIVSGDLNLYYIIANEKSTRGTLEKRSSGGASASHYNTSDLFYIRKNDNNRGKFRRVGAFWRKRFKKICSDCPYLINQINKDGYWSPNFMKYVNSYNIHCSK